MSIAVPAFVEERSGLIGKKGRQPERVIFASISDPGPDNIRSSNSNTRVSLRALGLGLAPRPDQGRLTERGSEIRMTGFVFPQSKAPARMGDVQANAADFGL